MFEFKPPEESIDRQIGTKVMGWKVLSHWDSEGTIKHLVDENQCEVRPAQFKPYSTDMNAAWEVIEKFCYPILYFDQLKVKWVCSLSNSAHLSMTTGKIERVKVEAEHIDAPMAICLAALEAVL